MSTDYHPTSLRTSVFKGSPSWAWLCTIGISYTESRTKSRMGKSQTIANHIYSRESIQWRRNKWQTIRHRKVDVDVSICKCLWGQQPTGFPNPFSHARRCLYRDVMSHCICRHGTFRCQADVRDIELTYVRLTVVCWRYLRFIFGGSIIRHGCYRRRCIYVRRWCIYSCRVRKCASKSEIQSQTEAKRNWPDQKEEIKVPIIRRTKT